MINEGATAFRDLLKRLGPMGLAFISWTVIVVAALTGAPESFLERQWPQLFRWWWITAGAWGVWAVAMGIATGLRERRLLEIALKEQADGRYEAPSLGLE